MIINTSQRKHCFSFTRNVKLYDVNVGMCEGGFKQLYNFERLFLFTNFL